jgi:hypothetical protein
VYPIVEDDGMTNVAERLALPTPADAERLCRVEEEWCVSIYLPVRDGWGDLAQNAIRLKNLVRRAEERLESLGADADSRRRLLSPVYGELLSGRSLRLPAGGLAVFLVPGEAWLYQLPGPVGELVHVGRRFHVRPVLDAAADDRHCLILTLGLGGVRLYSCDPRVLDTVDLPDIPASLRESLRFDVFENHRQQHTGSARRGGGQGASVQVHGQGGGADRANVKRKILEFFRQVAAGVMAAVAGRSDPLVLVGLPHLVGLYREANRYPHLVAEAVLADPEPLGREALRDRALGVLAPRERERRDELLNQFGTLQSASPERTATHLEDVLGAAATGRVDTLIVARGERAWGRYAGPDRAVVHTVRRTGDEDLVDRAAWYTLRQGGGYRPVEPDMVPGGGPAAAILRY